MRTVTFSEPNVQNILNQNFVNTFTNTNGDPTAGQSIKHRPTDPAGPCIRGNGQQNVQTLFMTPAGEIFHVATGFLSGDDLLKEAGFALDLFKQIKNNRNSDPSSFVAQAHRDRLKSLGFDESEINEQNDMARIMSMMNATPIGGRSGRVPGGANQSGSSMPGANIFQPFIERQFLEDNQFSIKHPMISHKQLERDPTQLVGNGQSFFASSSSGN